jgi:two-component system, chemotaxis family, CheB/CheR fusion protein
MGRMNLPGALAGLRVLLVEDAEDIRDVLTFLLRGDGAHVWATGTARAALDAAAIQDFDVLVTDLGLPDVAGDHLIREILGMKRLRPRVIVITGFGEPYAERARQAGADAVFIKPLDWTDLRAALRVHQEAVAA